MKKTWKVLLMVFAVAFGVMLFNGTSSKAAVAITGLKQTKATSSSVTVQWQPYMATDVYYATYIGTSAASLTRKDPAYRTDNYISGLTEGGVYYVQVRAYSDSSRTKQIAASNTIQVATELADVTGGAQISATANTVTLRWNSVGGATGYYVYRYINGNYIQVAASKTNSCTVSRLLRQIFMSLPPGRLPLNLP